MPSAQAKKSTTDEESKIASVVEVSLDEQPYRIQHARELLGRKIRKSLVNKAGKVENLEPFIFELTKKFLGKNQKKHARAISKAVLSESRKYGFDPLFVMAVIQNESSFNTKLVGSVGEIGLMQIRPTTAKWLGGLRKIKYRGRKSLFDPTTNIRFGVALMDKLRDQFDAHSRLYISAYNIGAKKVRSMVEEDRTPRDYVLAVMKRYLAIYQAFTEKDIHHQVDVAYDSITKLTRSSVGQEKVRDVKISDTQTDNSDSHS